DRAAQAQRDDLDARLLVQLATHPGDHVLVPFELAAEAVVLAEMMVAGAGIAVDHQHALAVRREHVAEGGQDRGIGHRRLARNGGGRIACDNRACPRSPSPAWPSSAAARPD